MTGQDSGDQQAPRSVGNDGLAAVAIGLLAIALIVFVIVSLT